MPSIAFQKRFHVKEIVGATSLGEYYLVSDPETGAGLATVEEQVTLGQKIAKAFVDKAFLSVNLSMKTPEGSLILEIFQPASLFRSVFTVRNADGKILCLFKQKISLFCPGVVVEDAMGQRLGTIEGGWRFRKFQFKDLNGEPVATIRHLPGGLAKELLTTADDYEVDVHADSSMSLISLAATICIDFMFHES